MNQIVFQKNRLSKFIVCLYAVFFYMFLSTGFVEAAVKEMTLSGHTAEIQGIDISSDGKYLVSGGKDCVAKVWNLTDGTLLKTLTSYTEINNKNKEYTVKGHKKDVYSVAFSQGNEWIATASDDKTLKIWSFDAGKIIRSIDCGYYDFRIHFSPDGNFIAGAFDDLVFWNTSDGSFDGFTLGVTKTPFAFSFSHDSKIVAAGNSEGKVQLWKNKQGNRGELRTLSKSRTWNDISEIAFSPDDRLLVAVSNMYAYKNKMPENLKIWEVDTGRLLWSKEGERLDVVTFSPDGKVIVTGGNGVIQVWDTQGNLLRKIPINDSVLSKICMLDDGRIIVSATEKNDIKVWSIDPEV